MPRNGHSVELSEVFGINSPADNPAWPDTKHLRVKSRSLFLAAGCQDLCLTSYFNLAHRPRIHRRQIVDYERYPGIVDDVTIFLSHRESTVTPDLDCIYILVIAENNRYHLGLDHLNRLLPAA